MIVLVIRGLLSVWLSRAMETLSARLSSHGMANVLTDHGNAMCWFCNVKAMTQQCVDAKMRGEKIVLVGHSFGATSVLMIARALNTLGILVDFAGPIDPAHQYDTSAPHNILRGVSFYQLTPGQLGQGIVKPSNPDVWSISRRDETHLAIAADPIVQDAMFNGVKLCLKP